MRMKKFGKKIFGAILTAALISVMGLSAFAAPSVSSNAVVQKILSATDKNGTDVDVEIVDIPEEYKAVVQEIRSAAKLKEVLGSAYVDTMEVVDVREVRIVGDASKVQFPVTITFEVPGVLATTKVAVLHYVDGAWKVEPSKAGKGTITATFDSLSPVAFVVDKSTSASGVTSPKTGQDAGVTAAAIMVVTALGGAVLLKRKEFAK